MHAVLHQAANIIHPEYDALMLCLYAPFALATICYAFQAENWLSQIVRDDLPGVSLFLARYRRN